LLYVVVVAVVVIQLRVWNWKLKRMKFCVSAVVLALLASILAVQVAASPTADPTLSPTAEPTTLTPTASPTLAPTNQGSQLTSGVPSDCEFLRGQTWVTTEGYGMHVTWFSSIQAGGLVYGYFQSYLGNNEFYFDYGSTAFCGYSRAGVLSLNCYNGPAYTTIVQNYACNYNIYFFNESLCNGCGAGSTSAPTEAPTSPPTEEPTSHPTIYPTHSPTDAPTPAPTTVSPTIAGSPTRVPTPNHGLIGFNYGKAAALSSDDFTCMADNDFDYFVQRGYVTWQTAHDGIQNDVDPNLCSHLRLAYNAGLDIQGIVIQARPRYVSYATPITAVKRELVNNCAAFANKPVYLSILENQFVDYGWSNLHSHNKLWLEHYLITCKQYFSSCGVFASETAWTSVFGSSSYTNATAFKHVPLWYRNDGSNTNFKDYSSIAFGGWSSPSMKQYTKRSEVCEISVGLDWVRESS
jgi:hypothetical protein